MKKLLLLITVLFLASSCSPKLFNEKWLTQEAPEYFTARFETTQGNFDIEAKREWSPLAVDRLYQLLKNDFYQDVSIFRVVPNFVAQFGIHNQKEINDFWDKHKVDDEPVVEKNTAMTISFARGGRKSRGTQLFINLKNNNRLDKLNYGGVKGYPVVAKVVSGEDVVKKFYNGYREKPSARQDSIHKYGNAFLKNKFPKIDYITKAYLLKK